MLLLYYKYMTVNGGGGGGGGALSSWSHGSWVDNFLWNRRLSPLMMRVRISLRRGVLYTTICDKFVRDFRQVGGFRRVLQFPPPIANILWQVALKTVILTPTRKCIHKTDLSFLTQCFLHQIKFIYDGISICLIVVFIMLSF